MAFHVNVDRLGDSDVPTGDQRLVILRGRIFRISGWAADPVARRVAQSIIGVVDGTRQIDAALHERPDVAAHFAQPALSSSGFHLDVPTADLALGDHRVELSVLSSAGDATRIGPIAFSVKAPAARLTPGVRILVAASPKSGSSYTTEVLKAYYGPQHLSLGGVRWLWDNNLDVGIQEQLRGKSYVIHSHLRPHPANLGVIAREDVSVVVTWRNVADTLVSLDDYLLKVGVEPGFMLHLHDAEYRAMDQQERYQFLIRFAVPWYVNFYLGWKGEKAKIFRYETMASNPGEFFRDVLTYVEGEVDPHRLEQALRVDKTSGDTRFNVGTIGRSTSRFSAETKDLLESMLRSHPGALDDLLDELPWNNIRT